MAITYFPVVGEIIAVIADRSNDDDGTPTEQPVSSLVTFTPSVKEVRFEGQIVRLRPITARTEEDGVLKTIDGNQVELAANCFGLDELSYLVEFSKATIDGERDQRIDPFRFLAPEDDTEIDLATVERRAI